MLKPPNILTIAGSDSSGGAGIQADLKTIMALGGYGMSVIAALTAQNGERVAGVEPAAPAFVALQLTTLLDGYAVAAAKTGMLFSAAIIEAVAPILKKRSWPLVVDPVCVSQSGYPLLEESAIAALVEHIIPGCDLLTPNRPEAEKLTGEKIESSEDVARCGEKLLRMGARAVLIKGGHFPGAVMVNDYLIRPGLPPKTMPMPRVDTNNNHGTGCSLSAAIACGLGAGLPLEVAVARAQRFLNAALLKSYAPGKGPGPINHSFNTTAYN